MSNTEEGFVIHCSVCHKIHEAQTLPVTCQNCRAGYSFQDVIRKSEWFYRQNEEH